MITEKYKNFSDYGELEQSLIQQGYIQYFKNEDYFSLIDISIIEYNYDNFRIFVCDDADVIVVYNNEIISTLFTTELSSIKIDNKNDLLAIVSWEFDFILIDFKSKKVYNSINM